MSCINAGGVMDNFRAYAYYYDMIYKDKDYQKEAEIVQQLIQEYQSGKGGKRLLNLGCGTGKHDNEFEKLGYETFGIDISETMIKIAKENNEESKFEVADIRNCFLKGQGKFDIVISLFHVMSYQNKNEDILNAFNTAYENLRDKGLFVFDVWYGPGVLSDRPGTRVKKASNQSYEVIRYATPTMYANDNIVNVHYDIVVIDEDEKVTKIEEDHSMRYFFKPEIEYMLKQSGFELVVCLDCQTLKEPDFDSWTVYFCALKSAD